MVTLGDLLDRLEVLRLRHGRDLPVYEYDLGIEYPLSHLWEVAHCEPNEQPGDFLDPLPERILIN